MLHAVAGGAALNDACRASLLNLAALGLSVYLWAKDPAGVPGDHCASGELSAIKSFIRKHFSKLIQHYVNC